MAVTTPHTLEYPPLVRLLADGQLRSGEWLARELGVSRAAVWKTVERLRRTGIEIEAQPRQGYRLPRGVELFDARLLRQQIRPERLTRLRRLELLFEVDSTNTRLLAAPPPPAGRSDVVVAELQSAGRGRRGRRWIASFGASLMMSMAHTFAEAPGGLSALSLVVGIAVVRALRRAGAQDLALKWPNDIWHRGAKLGGILIEIKAEAAGPVHAVIGVGINIALPERGRREIEREGAQAAALSAACAQPPCRNAVAGALIDELLGMLALFAVGDPGHWRLEWETLDALSGKPVQVLLADRSVRGTARGIDDDGALLVETAQGLQRFLSGDATLRPAAQPC